VEDGRFNALVTQMPPEWLDLILVEPDKYTAVAGPPDRPVLLLIQDELETEQTDLKHECPCIFLVVPVQGEAELIRVEACAQRP
jgi:hypothetical protein